MATQRDDGNKGRKVSSSGLGNITQTDTPWGGGDSVKRPFNDPKSGGKTSVDSKVFDKNGTNEIPWIADAAKKGDSSNVSGRIFSEAGTTCEFDGGGKSVSQPFAAGKSGSGA